MTIKPVLTPEAPSPRGFYSQAVQAGNLLYISGQLPLDASGRMIEGGIAGQARQALGNVEAILRAAGGSLSSLVQVTIYVSDIEHWPAVNAVYELVMKEVPVPPARAVVPVKEMHFGAMIEVQGVAVLD